VLQEGTFEAVGDDRTRKVDVRVIAATNRSRRRMTWRRQIFRRDLYYRLSVLPVHVPPLRERREDILTDGTPFSGDDGSAPELPARPLSAEDERALLGYEFPGNVRELQNIVERALVLDPRWPRSGRSSSWGAAPSRRIPRRARPCRAATRRCSRPRSCRRFERQNLLNALQLSQFRIAGDAGAARRLGLSPSTLAYRMKQLGIQRPRLG